MQSVWKRFNSLSPNKCQQTPPINRAATSRSTLDSSTGTLSNGISTPCGKNDSSREKHVNGSYREATETLKSDSMRVHGHKEVSYEGSLQQKVLDEVPFMCKSEKVASGSSKYNIGGVIGKGTFAKVYEAFRKSDGKKVAIKSVKWVPLFRVREPMIHGLLDHPNVVRLVDETFSCSSGERNKDNTKCIYYNLVMEYVPYTLLKFISSARNRGLKRAFHSALLRNVMMEVLLGIEYVHGLGIVHRDLKPENILCEADCTGVKICDFGNAKEINEGASVPYICTRLYRAPELVYGSTCYGRPVDIWSIGIIALEMITTKPLLAVAGSELKEAHMDYFGPPTAEDIRGMRIPEEREVLLELRHLDEARRKEAPTIYQIIHRNTTMDAPAGESWEEVKELLSDDLLDLLGKMLMYNPEKRIKASDALKHQFFTNYSITERKISKKVPTNIS